jgi:drug/metabolite transporter (DMT)-like permease
MINGTEYALAALVAYGFSDFIYKRSAQAKVKASQFLMGQAWCFCPLVVLYAAATRTLVIAPPALCGCVAGLLLFVGLHQFLRSLENGPVSITAPVFRLNFIITAVLAIAILGEPVSLLKIAGFLFALAATWLLVAGWPGGARHAGREFYTQVAVATATMGAANFAHKLGLTYGMTPETMLAAQAIVFISLATVFVRLTEGTLRIPAVTWRYSAPAAIVLTGAFLFMLYGLSVGPASTLVPIAQMGFVVTSALGIAFLGEPLTGRKAAGLLCALAALTALAVG